MLPIAIFLTAIAITASFSDKSLPHRYFQLKDGITRDSVGISCYRQIIYEDETGFIETKFIKVPCPKDGLKATKYEWIAIQNRETAKKP